MSATEDIQQALNVVRSATADADWQTRLDALLLLLSVSEDIVRRARQLTEPKQRTRTVTVPKVKTVRRYSTVPQPKSKPAAAPSLAAVQAKPPLPPKITTVKPQ